jgi:predicted GNAT superfamily acetyltransferase
MGAFMPALGANDYFYLRILEDAQEMTLVEDLQKIVWPGNDTDIVPKHLLLTAAHNGGLVIGAFEDAACSTALVGFVFSFPGLYETPDGPRLKHCSHMLAVHPSFRDQGIGFALKRAQWQMVRQQGIDRITWTYDPLQSRNAYLNIARLGGVCNCYLPDAYGEMRDGLNSGLPSDRFQIDWWVNSHRVSRRLSRRARVRLDLKHFLEAEIRIINPTEIGPDGLPKPVDTRHTDVLAKDSKADALLLLEIPADFQALKAMNMDLALAWRLHTRNMLATLFNQGYLATDFVYLPEPNPRSFYVLSHGDQTL